MSMSCFSRQCPRRCSLPVLAVVVAVVMGCGQAEYDQLVKQRISYLRNPPTPTAPEWMDFASPNFGYSIEAPVEPEVNAQLQDGTEQLTMQLASVVYQVQFVEGTDQTSLESAAKATEDLYVVLGYTMASINDENINGLPCSRMRFTKTRSEDTAIVQVFYLADKQQTCAMAVVGKDYSQDDAARFLESFVIN